MAAVKMGTVLEELNGLKETIMGLERKKFLLINSLHHSSLHLISPVAVSVEYDGYQFIAYTADLDIYGCGDSEYEAIEDLRQSIVELYYDLKNEPLGKDLEKIWEYLSCIVREE
ncbi:MAG: hypothetical protein QME81_00925 [bacterium]|nr:hypothetical protein [bacterium]